MYQINEQNVDLLERIRSRLEGELLGETTVGGTIGAHNAEPGEGGAMNTTDVDDALNMYLDTILERLTQEVGMGEAQGTSFIMTQAAALSTEGDLPPFPDDGSDDEVSIWLGKAKTLGFEYYVLTHAHNG